MWKPPTRGATPPIEKNLDPHNRPTTRQENLGAATSTAGFLYRCQRLPRFYGLPRQPAFLPKAESGARRQAAVPCGLHPNSSSTLGNSGLDCTTQTSRIGASVTPGGNRHVASQLHRLGAGALALS